MIGFKLILSKSPTLSSTIPLLYRVFKKSFCSVFSYFYNGFKVDSENKDQSLKFKWSP